MPLDPLTPANVQDKLDHLYSMSDPDLALEADAIADDFIGWIDKNFSLTIDQDSYIRGIDSKVIKDYGTQCAICFINRLSITLIYPVPPGPGYSKWVSFSNDLVVKANDSDIVEATGSLTFEMEYRL